MDVIDYVREEVRRQGHDCSVLDGIERVGWMLEAWSYALRQHPRPARPAVTDVIQLGMLIEPLKNRFGLRTAGVRVGLRTCPEWQQVPAMLERLFEHGADLTPVEFYKEFEMIHPFIDGNGRTGKVILNWLNGTLHDPVFPPNDLFGTPIRNP